MNETCCTHEHKHEDLNKNRTKNSLNSSCSKTRAAFSAYLQCYTQAKCINNLTMFRHGFAVELHVNSQPRFVFVFRFVKQALSHEQENRFT